MKFFSKKKIIAFFTKHFSFESDIDLSNETEVLFRRNVVIKNIIFLSNIVYSSILFVLNFGSDEPGSWLFTVIPFPITFLINKTIKRLIHQDKDVLITQQVAMYMSSFYMFLSAILIYLKLSVATDPYLADAGYMLIYYSLIVVSLYQNRSMLKRVFTWMLPMITVVHVLLTHNLFSYEYSAELFTFLKEFFTTTEFRDIAFRTVIMICFMIVVYVICVLGEKMSEARTQELGKRQEIQQDFTVIVSDLFDVLIKSRAGNDVDESRDESLYLMTQKLSSLYGLEPKKGEELAQYSIFLTKHKNDFKLENVGSDEDNFEFLRNQSELGTKLVKRIELADKTEKISRAHHEGEVSPAFTNSMNKIQKNSEMDIILLADLYITLREYTTYKRPYTHVLTMDHIRNQFHVYFESALIERFIKYQTEFENIYDRD
ncbi:MAG: hypothetical protein R3Y60_01390 [bacterium]